MITRRPSADRGHINHGWLNTYHTFSFGDYFDPQHMGFRSLRVINEDFVAGQQGFGEHPHRDMEIVTYILSGQLQHRDSMGNGSTIQTGDVQRMTAGTGVTHSEFNPFPEAVHLLQIWIIPAQKSLKPGYEQKNFGIHQKPNRLHLIASPDGRDGSVTVHQDAFIHAAHLQKGESLNFPMASGRGVWIQVASGTLTANGTELKAGDGASVESETELQFTATDSAEFLLFDLQ